MSTSIFLGSENLPIVKTKLAIILINYKDYAKKYLVDYWNSIKNEDYPFDIIFVDNESSEESRAYLKKIVPNVVIVSSETNSGYAGGMNLGAKKARELGYKYVLFGNFDAEVKSGYLAELVKVLESDDKIGAAQSRAMLFSDKDKVNSLGNSIHYLGLGFSAGGYQDFDLSKCPKVFPITYPSGVSFLMKLDLFERLGGFEKSFFMYHEDLDLGWKIRLAGYEVVLARDSVIYHKYKFAQSMKQYFWMERNRFFTILKNYKLATILVFLPALAIMELGLFIFSFFNGFWCEKLRVYAELFKFSFWQEVSAGRKFIKKIRKVSDHKILAKFVGKIEFQEVENPVLKYVANPLFNLYFLN